MLFWIWVVWVVWMGDVGERRLCYCVSGAVACIHVYLVHSFIESTIHACVPWESLGCLASGHLVFGQWSLGVWR